MKKASLILIVLLVVFISGCSNNVNNNDNGINVYDYYSSEQRENMDFDVIYLWNKGNMPKVKDYIENNGNYFEYY